MKNTIFGKIKQISEEQIFGENSFRKKEVIIKTIEEYPNFYKVEFTQDKVALLDDLKEEQTVQIKVNIKGREHTNDRGNYNVFHSIVGWQIERV